MKILEYIYKKGFEGKRRGEEFICNCPFCEDKEKKFQINLVSGLFTCNHANSCGVKGNFIELQRKLGDVPEKIHQNSVYTPRKKAYVKPNIDLHAKDSAKESVMKYLHSRGFSDDTISAFRIGYDLNTVMLPYFKNGELVNVKYRDITNKRNMRVEKDAEPTLFNRDNIEENILNICEGEYDCMALHQYGIEAVSVPNGAKGMQWIDNEWEYLETFDKIYICFDNDEAGIDGAHTLANKLGLWRCYIVTLPMKDANECLVNNVHQEEIQKSFAEAKDLSPDSIVSPMIYAEQIKDMFAKGTSLAGTPTAWSALDNILKGWRGGEVTVWTGRNGSGKSTILNQCFIDIAKRGEKTCIYSGEMPPQRYLRWALVQLSEKAILEPVQVDVYLDWMSDRIYIINVTGGIEPDELLQAFEYAARRYDVKHFIIDSLMKIKINEADEYSEQKKFVSLLCDFAQKFNVHVHLVAHPRKTQSDADNVGKVDVKGSSHITDLSCNVISLARVDEEVKQVLKQKGKVPCDMYMYVKKNREFGIEGRISFEFNPETKNFTVMGV